MRCESHDINTVFVYIHRNLSNGLYRIREEQNAVLLGKGTDLFYGLDHADLVIGIHDRDQNGSWLNGRFQFFQVDQSIGFHFQVGNFSALALNMFTGIQYSFVFCGTGNDMVTLAGIHFKYPFDTQVITFSGTGGENDLFCIGTNQFGYLLTGIIHGFFRFPSKRVVTAGGIPKMLGEIRYHRFQHTRIHGCGGIVIQVNR